MKKEGFTGYNQNMKERSRELRQNMTRQESLLWYYYLKDYPVKFYRQRSVGVYIVDFYCSKAKLVIEIDGSQHFDPDNMDYDRKRTYFLEQYGLKVIRVTNRDIDTNMRGVCDLIDFEVNRRINQV